AVAVRLQERLAEHHGAIEDRLRDGLILMVLAGVVLVLPHSKRVSRRALHGTLQKSPQRRQRKRYRRCAARGGASIRQIHDSQLAADSLLHLRRKPAEQ